MTVSEVLSMGNRFGRRCPGPGEIFPNCPGLFVSYSKESSGSNWKAFYTLNKTVEFDDLPEWMFLRIQFDSPIDRVEIVESTWQWDGGDQTTLTTLDTPTPMVVNHPKVSQAKGIRWTLSPPTNNSVASVTARLTLKVDFDDARYTTACLEKIECLTCANINCAGKNKDFTQVCTLIIYLI